MFGAACPRSYPCGEADAYWIIDYDEFSFFEEIATEFDLPWEGPPAVARVAVEVGGGRRLSALVWGQESPQLVLLHGGAQNAHTWDTVAMALGRPLLAVDLPGHGHSDDGPPGGFDIGVVAGEVAEVVERLAPSARAVVGMSLGGMVTLALADSRPELVRKVVLVDVTPGVNREKARAIHAFVEGPESFATFEEILVRTIEHNPTRSVSSLRRGVLHNAVQRPDGRWVWRYRRFPGASGAQPDFSELWEAISRLKVPLMLVRGTREGSVVDDADEAELLRRRPDARVVHVDAGHSVQGDAPLELARLIADFV